MTDHHKGPPAGLAGTTDRIDAGDGWLIVRLLTKQSLLREGEHMDHCVGDGSYEELTGDEDLTSDAIWSLRDPDGVSRATLDVRAGIGGRRHVLMAKGPRNLHVRRSDARRLQALVMTFRGAGVSLDFAGETRLVMADDGRVMREDQAPEEVREQARARHGERRQVRRVGIMGSLLPTYDELAADGWRVGWRDLQGRLARASENPFSDLIPMQVLQRQPLTSKACTDLKRGDIVDLPGHHVTDVVVRSGGETLREGEDYGVDVSVGMVEFKRDVPGSTLIAFRPGPEPQREVLFPTLGIPWTEEPLLSDRVTVGVDTQVPRYGPGGGGGYVMVQTRTVRDFLSLQMRTGPGEQET